MLHAEVPQKKLFDPVLSYLDACWMQMWPEGLAGIEIKVDGFSHKLPLLVDYIFQQLVSLKVHADRFERVREGLVRRYKNANFKPDKHATYLRLYAIKQKMWPVEVVQAQLESLTPLAVQGGCMLMLVDLYLISDHWSSVGYNRLACHVHASSC